MKIDLHLHSNLSDGILTPEEIVNLALKNGCDKISITDHELVSNFDYLEEKYPIEIFSGIEFNSSIRNLHLLGYGIKEIDGLNESLHPLKEKNSKICYEVIDAMARNGFDISASKVIEYIEKLGINCDILDKRKLVKYLIYKGYACSVIEAYNRLIGVNKKYYIPNYKLSPIEIINRVKEAKGIAVLAHPNTLNVSIDELKSIIYNLKEHGLAGIEVINSKMGAFDKQVFGAIANELGLLQTVGSDFHSLDNQTIGIEVEPAIFEDFKKQILKRTKS